VQGVAAPFPHNSDFNFHLITGYQSAPAAPKTRAWSMGDGYVFVQLRQLADAPALAAQMSRYLPLFNAHNLERPATAFVLVNLKTPAPRTYDVNHHPAFAAIMSAIALVLLVVKPECCRGDWQSPRHYAPDFQQLQQFNPLFALFTCQT